MSKNNQPELIENDPPHLMRLINKIMFIRRRIEALIGERNINQTTLAQRMGVQTSYLSRILRTEDASNITLETVAKFEEALNAIILATPIEIENAITRDFDKARELFQVASKKHNERVQSDFVIDTNQEGISIEIKHFDSKDLPKRLDKEFYSFKTSTHKFVPLNNEEIVNHE